jgi:small subunit ribosomal protein S13
MKSIFKNQLKLEYGINDQTVSGIYKSLGLNTRCLFDKLTKKQLGNLNQNLKSFNIGKRLKDTTKEILNFSIKLKNYKGIRHKLKYPARGQRTHTNAKTKKKIKI